MTGFAEPRDAVDAGGQTSLIVEAPVCPLAYNSAQPRIVRYDLQLGEQTNLREQGQKQRIPQVGFNSGKICVQKAFQSQ